MVTFYLITVIDYFRLIYYNNQNVYNNSWKAKTDTETLSRPNGVLFFPAAFPRHTLPTRDFNRT